MSSFIDGYNAFAKSASLYSSALGGAEYIKNVQTAIDDLEKVMNNDLAMTILGAVKKTDKMQLKGDAAEYWHAYTHNIDAAVNDVSARADVIRSHVVGSVDVQGNWDDGAYGLKYIRNAEESAKAQSEIYRTKYEHWADKNMQGGVKPSISDYFELEYKKYLRECEAANRTPRSIDEVFPGIADLNNPLYFHQFRLVPKDQLKDVETYLRQQLAAELHGGRADQVKRYEEALSKLTDRIKSNEGSESIPLTKEDAELIAQLAK